MIRFALGLMLPYLGILTYQAYEWRLDFAEPSQWQSLIGPAIGFGAAMLTVLLLTIVLDYRRPRRMLSRGSKRALRPVFAGVAISALTVLFAIPAVVFGSEYAPDWLLLCVSSVPPGLLVLLLSKSIVPGQCAACGFDLRASLDAGRCPECGRGIAACV
ncbi:MAG: hypothetical protein H6819_03560 [Phycisphaerales bacterium]|nr:hypothetical protein [Phycisphaerales bacterium]MCB9856274.1 hypothetical protein [Phycisphaerales bacterium]MCB9863287.1 hypothetical protein [Phycisphaerales bacterium]